MKKVFIENRPKNGMTPGCDRTMLKVMLLSYPLEGKKVKVRWTKLQPRRDDVLAPLVALGHLHAVLEVPVVPVPTPAPVPDLLIITQG